MTDWYEELHREGFTIARGLLPSGTAHAGLASIHRTVAAQLEHLGQAVPDQLHSALGTLFRADIERYKRTVGALWRKSDISSVMRHEKLFEFVRTVLGWGDVFLPGGDVAFLMAPDLRIPGGYFGLGAHQDFPSVQGSLDGLVVWIPLTHINRDSFTLEVWPGSHRRGLITEVDHSENGWVILPESLEEGAFVPVSARPGDVVFMSTFTIHRSGISGNGLRIALSTRFDNASEPSFVARGYPTAYQRRVHREQYFPGFPSEEEVEQVWGQAVSGGTGS